MNITLYEYLKVDDEEWKKKMNLTKREQIQHKFFKAIASISYNFNKEVKDVWGDNRSTYVIGLREIIQSAVNKYIDESISSSAILNPDSIDDKIVKPKLTFSTELYEDSVAAVITLSVIESDSLHWTRKITVPVEMYTGHIYKIKDICGTEHILCDPEDIFENYDSGYFDCRRADTGDRLILRYASILEGRNHKVIFNPEKNRNKDDAD